jgi:RES domain-containing protein
MLVAKHRPPMTSPPTADSSVTTLRGIVYRACNPAETNLAKTAASSRDDPGRFSTADVGAVYLAHDPDTAIAELRRTTEREGKSLVDAHPCAIIAIALDVDSIVDLSAPGALTAWGLTAEDLKSDDMHCCRTAAERIAATGAQGVRWPSAAARGHSLAIFVDRVQPSSRLQVVRTFELSCDMLRAFEHGACAAELIDEIREGRSRTSA